MYTYMLIIYTYILKFKVKPYTCDLFEPCNFLCLMHMPVEYQIMGSLQKHSFLILRTKII